MRRPCIQSSLTNADVIVARARAWTVGRPDVRTCQDGVDLTHPVIFFVALDALCNRLDSMW
jgi:hypothetical protein